MILKQAIYHKIHSSYAYPFLQDKAVIKIRTAKNNIDKINLVITDKWLTIWRDLEIKKIKMQLLATDNLFDYYQIIFPLGNGTLSYYFELVTNSEKSYYGNHYFYNNKIKQLGNMFSFNFVNNTRYFQVPDKFKDAIIYQIFPDRFNRGSGYNLSGKIQEWGTKPENDSKFGGTLQGIIEKLDYLEDLGIDTIYLTPIFRSDSNHKYDTIDYYEIDPDFGNKELFKKLVSRAHKKNIKIILDAVFNHCSHNFFAFKDVIEKGKESEYKEMFTIYNFPVNIFSKGVQNGDDFMNYHTFGYVYFQPKFNYSNKMTSEYFINVAEYWTKETDIDGWRFDVADEVPIEFWRELRNRLKKIRNDIFLIGEIAHSDEASSYLSGDCFDSVMNYHFRKSIMDFFIKSKISPEEFSESLGYIKGRYKLQTLPFLWNLLGSHDTRRIVTEVNNNIQILKLVILFQFTSQGIPVIYYGDEIGLSGGDDPDCRKCMTFSNNSINIEILDYYKKLVKIRKANRALTYGTQLTFYNNQKNIFGLTRKHKGQIISIYFNNDLKKHEIEISRKYVNLLTGEIGSLGIIEIEAKTGVILKLK